MTSALVQSNLSLDGLLNQTAVPGLRFSLRGLCRPIRRNCSARRPMRAGCCQHCRRSGYRDPGQSPCHGRRPMQPYCPPQVDAVLLVVDAGSTRRVLRAPGSRGSEAGQRPGDRCNPKSHATRRRRLLLLLPISVKAASRCPRALSCLLGSFRLPLSGLVSDHPGACASY